MRKHTSDIMIVGGGMVGLTLACMLAQSTTLSITLLDAQHFEYPWTSDQYQHRVSAIALSSQRIFKNLKLWETIKAARVSPFKKIEVWDEEGKGEIAFDSKEMAEPNLGYIIENNLLQKVLVEKLKCYPQVSLIGGVKLASMTETSTHRQLITPDCLYQATLVVAADGAHSFIREQAGITLDKHAYEQTAIVAEVTTALPHHAVARQVFLPAGPLAFLPLVNACQSSIVWSLPQALAKEYLALDANAFQQALGRAFAYRLGDIEAVGQRFSFPLSRQQAGSYIASRLALVGDAAHTMHPLAGQGVNLGLLDAASLVDVLVDGLHARKSIGSHGLLRRYERWRRADNAALLLGVDKLKALFASDKKSLQVLRSTGLNAINRAAWIKNLLGRHAIGERDNLPQFARS